MFVVVGDKYIDWLNLMQIIVTVPNHTYGQP